MMLATTELRWFFRGEVPSRMAGWIRHGELWRRQPERVDQYLEVPGCAVAGVKLREGRLEVKVQTAAPTAMEYPGGVRGYRDAWVKWSRELGEAAPDRAFWSAAGERWIPVRKRRAERGFSLDGVAAGAIPREVSIDDTRPDRGCSVEITEVGVGAEEAAERWWTLGLEGFDLAGDPTGALQQVACSLFEQEPPPLPLRLDDSSSYATWLSNR